MRKAIITAGFVATSLLAIPVLEFARGQATADHRTASAVLEGPKSGAVGWADYDADGLVDAYVIGADGRGRLLRNRSDGSFEDVTERAGLESSNQAHSALWADVDANGLVDLFLASYAGESQLFLQSPGGVFSDHTASVGLDASARPMLAEWIDYDLDGLVDLHLSTWSAELLYHNEGGHFEPVALGPEFERTHPALTGAPFEPPAELGEALRQRQPHAWQADPRLALSSGTAASVAARLRAPLPTNESFSAACSSAIEDQDSPGSCIFASTVPTDGLLYPLGEDFHIDATGNRRVGIGTTNPSRKLHVAGGLFAENSSTLPTANFRQNGAGRVFECESAAAGTIFEVRNAGGVRASSNGSNAAVTAQNADGGHALLGLSDGGDATLRLRQDGSGRILLAENSTEDLFWVRNAGGVTSICTDGSNNLGLSTAVYAENTSGTSEAGNAIYARTRGVGTTVLIDQVGTGDYLKGRNASGNTKWRITNTGRVVTTALEITGGGDLVEGFDAGERELEAGTVVVIDPDNPGKLMESSGAYDGKVAGAISGAGGVRHGIRMGQDDVLDGDALVAMTGRVYVKCSAENGAIAAGDLLTTAELAGHAMKATDAERSNGAVIGKAMSALNGGTGLVLVLVNLQ